MRRVFPAAAPNIVCLVDFLAMSVDLHNSCMAKMRLWESCSPQTCKRRPSHGRTRYSVASLPGRFWSALRRSDDILVLWCYETLPTSASVGLRGRQHCRSRHPAIFGNIRPERRSPGNTQGERCYGKERSQDTRRIISRYAKGHLLCGEENPQHSSQDGKGGTGPQP